MEKCDGHFSLFSGTSYSIYPLPLLCLKGLFTPKSKIHIYPLTCGAIYQSRLFWCELSSFGDIGRRDFCLPSNVMGSNVALNVHLENSKATSLSRNRDPVTQDDPQSLL